MASTTLDPAAFQDLFLRTRNGMLLADDERRFVAANPAACRFLGLSSEQVVGKTIDDFTPPERGDALEGLWQDFRDQGMRSGEYEFLLPGGERRRFEYSATAQIRQGLHLAILLAQPGDPDLERAAGERPSVAREQRLSPRELEVMTKLAAGCNGAEIARALQISPETVRNHTRSARQKLEARTRAHAIALAVRSGEIRL